MDQSTFRFEKGIEMTCKGPGLSISLSHTFGSRLLLQKKPAIPSGMAGFFLAIGKLMEFPWRFICKLDCAAVFKVFIHRLNCKSFSSLHTPNAPLALYQGERPPHSPILFRMAQCSPPLHRLSPVSTILWPSFPVIWPSD